MVLRHTKSKNKVVTVHAVKKYGGRRGIAPFILNIGNILRCVRLHFFFNVLMFCLLAIRLEDTSVYNLICCLVVVSWKGDHPAMSPQSCRSEVQRLFSLLLRVGCVSVSTNGLRWDSNLLRCLLILSLMTSRKGF